MIRSFACNSHAPANARHVIDEFGALLREDVRDDLRLVVTELVTNAVVHSRTGPEAFVRLDVRLYADHVRLEVLNEGAPFPMDARTPPGTDEHGWGLLIVERVASRWGVLQGSGTTVWAELALSGRPGTPG